MVLEQGECDVQKGPCVPKSILEEVHRWLSMTVTKVLDHLKGKNKTKKCLELLNLVYENILRVSGTGQRSACELMKSGFTWQAKGNPRMQ